MILPGTLLEVMLGPLIGKTVSELKNFADKTTSQMQEQVVRQELEQRIWEAKARTLQEFAIAARIENAETVEIEEIYDLSRKGGIGANVEGKNISLGLSMSGRRVKQRNYRFSGWREGSEGQGKSWEAFEKTCEDMQEKVKGKTPPKK